MGSVNVQLAEKTGFTQEDAEILKEALMTLFENDASSARPEGSMEVCRMYWWQHEEKTPAISSGKIQRGFDWNKDLDHPRSFKDVYKRQVLQVGVCYNVVKVNKKSELDSEKQTK